MTTKCLFKKQIIISISTNNAKTIISQANKYISNIDRLLKDMKSNVSADFIYSNNKEVIITTTASDLNIVKKYIKKLNNVDLNDIDLNDIMSP